MTTSMQVDTDPRTEPPITYPFAYGRDLDLPAALTEIARRRRPVRVQLPYGDPAWLVTAYDDARFVLADPRFSRNEVTRRDEPRMTPRPIPESILTMDAPDHTRVRRLVTKAFTMHRVESIRPWIGDLARRLVRDMRAAGDTADLIDDFALHFPTTVMCELFGVPQADRLQLRSWCDAVLSTGELTDDECVASYMEMSAYFQELIRIRRADPRDDLLSGLVEARDGGEQLDDGELLGLCIAIVIGGFETTVSEIGNFVFALQADDRRLWTALLADPSLVAGAVEEMLRYAPFAPNGISARYPTEDVVIGGVLVRAFEPVIVDTSAVNRDTTVYPDADRVCLDRPVNRHLVFGHGAHRCLGAHLATVELQEAMLALLAEMPDRRSAGTVEWKLDSHVHAPYRVPISW